MLEKDYEDLIWQGLSDGYIDMLEKDFPAPDPLGYKDIKKFRQPDLLGRYADIIITGIKDGVIHIWIYELKQGSPKIDAIQQVLDYKSIIEKRIAIDVFNDGDFVFYRYKEDWSKIKIIPIVIGSEDPAYPSKDYESIVKTYTVNICPFYGLEFERSNSVRNVDSESELTNDIKSILYFDKKELVNG